MQTILPLKPRYLRLGYTMQIAVFYAFHFHKIEGMAHISQLFKEAP